MNGEPKSEETIFAEAVALPPSERAAYLDVACASDVALRQRMDALLKSHEKAATFLERPPPDVSITRAASQSASITEKIGDRIGRYKLFQQIGEGGCGAVYMAEQEVPMRRRVALKVIKLGMDTKQVIARFEAERQALALMDHPNIAKVLDAGATEIGRPYFVMELVRGIKITEFCDKNHLTTQERLKLFIQVCQAVQHAHQKGIIHRDLKPSNILVTLDDGVPLPKIIDFGIAKAAQQRLTDKTLFTAFEQFIGTPAYMSPEQAEMSAQGVDTRSDIYSLGVLLYELLTGRTPFETEDLLRAGVEEIRRIIREEEPMRPSTKLSTMLEGELTATANYRQSEAPKLIHTVRGDLDWIVMKALEKDRTRRYETANGFARDLERYLAGEPVSAHPPSSIYRFQKTVRRNKMAFAAGAAIVLALLIGIVASTAEAIRARHAEEEQNRLRLQAETEKENAQTEAVKSRQVAQFLEDMLKGVGPRVALGRDTKLLRDILDQTAERLDKELSGQPGVEADLRATLGGVYMDIGDYTNDAIMQKKALELRTKLYGDENLAVAQSMNDLAEAYRKQSRLYEAESLHRQALAIREKLLGTNDPLVAESLDNLGITLQNNKPVEADALYRESLVIRRQRADRDPKALADTLLRLSLLRSSVGDGEEGGKFAREALTIYTNLKIADRSDVLDAVGIALRVQGKFADAVTVFRESMAIRKNLLGDKHPDLEYSYDNIGYAFLVANDLPQAEACYREAWNREMSDVSQSNMASPVWFGTDLVSVLQKEGKYREAETVYRQILTRQSKLFGPNDPAICVTLCDLADCQGKIGETNEVVKTENVVSDRVSRFSQDDLAKIQSDVKKLASFLYSHGKSAEAGKLCSEIPPDEVPNLFNDLAWDMATSINPQMRDGTNAVLLAERAVAATSRKDSGILDTLAAAYAEAGQFSKAVETEEEAISLLQDQRTIQDFTIRLRLYESDTPYRENVSN